MTKKILITLSVLLLIVVSIFTYNFYKNIKKPIKSDAILLVPQSAFTIIRGNSFAQVYQQLSTSNIIWEELTNNANFFKELNTNLQYLNKVTKNPQLFPFLTNQHVMASIHPLGANDLGFIFYFSTNDATDETALISIINKATNSTPTTRTYESSTIYNYTNSDNQKISLTFLRNTIAISYSTLLIEDVIRQQNTTTSLLNNSDFMSVYSTMGESEFGNIIVNSTMVSKFTQLILNQQSNQLAKKIDSFGGWLALDAGIKSNLLTFNGILHANDSSALYLKLFKKQKSGAIESLKIAPSNTAFIYSNRFDHIKSFFKDKKALLHQQNQADELESLLDNYISNYQLDIEEEWLNFLGNEISVIITEPKQDSNYTDNCFMIFKLKDAETAKEVMNKISLKVNSENYPTTIFNEHAISKIDLKNFFTLFFGKPFVNLDNQFYTILDDYLIFGNSEYALQNFISSNLNNKTLATDENFNLFQKNLSSSSSIFIYNNIARSVKLFQPHLNDEYREILEKHTELTQKFEAISIQIKNEKNNLYYVNVCLKYNPVYKQNNQSVWETQLEAEVDSKPKIVINHTDNTKEIFVQDINNKIYLISNTGKMLWSKQLDEKIVGSVHQIDALKNNKLQLLFSTLTKIHLIDRNGNYVGNYPIKLPNNSSNGITPMDYEKNKNYRLLVGCDDNMLYNFDIDGKQVNGWKYTKSNAPVTSAISHFVINNKDYVVFGLKNGEIKVIERNGTQRLTLKNKLPVSSFPIFVNTANDINKSFVITADSNGKITKLFFNDKVESFNLNDQKISSFEFADINGDHNKEIILNNTNKINAFDADKKNIFSFDATAAITSQIQSFELPNKTYKIGWVSNNEIMLINEKGVPEKNFPLTGSTLFCISNMSNNDLFHLVTADKNIIYLYNLEQ